MLQAKAGKSPFQVHARLPKRPKGGTMFLIETQRFFESKSDTTTTSKTLSQDGYMWTEILHQSDLITAKDNHLDYRLENTCSTQHWLMLVISAYKNSTHSVFICILDTITYRQVWAMEDALGLLQSLDEKLTLWVI